MLTLIQIKTNGDIVEKKVKKIEENTLYKHCNYKSDKEFELIHKFEIKNQSQVHQYCVYGKKSGRANTENKYDLPPPIDTLLLFVSRFSFVLAITIPFDIRDLKYDDLSLRTIPQILGEQKAKMIALYCLAFFELISIFHFFVGDFSWQLLLALMLTSLLSGILIIKSSQEKNNLFFSFWVEGASTIMYLLLFIIPLAFGILAL